MPRRSRPDGVSRPTGSVKSADGIHTFNYNRASPQSCTSLTSDWAKAVHKNVNGWQKQCTVYRQIGSADTLRHKDKAFPADRRGSDQPGCPFPEDYVTPRRYYANDLADRQWQVIRQLLPPRNRQGRRPIDRRRIVNAIVYVVRTKYQWRMLPKNYPNWNTVYGIFWKWRNDGRWQKIHDTLREKVRKQSGKKSTPTAAIIDSQSIRNAERGTERG